MPAAGPSEPIIPTAPLTAQMRDSLRAIVGEKGLIEDEHGKQPFVTDWRGLLVGRAGAVVRPGSTEEVSKVVRLCHQHGVAIVPQGGNTGLMGGATPWPAHTGIVLSLGRMNRVLDVDPVGYAMTVEAGCVLQTLQETAAEHDRFLPLSLGAQGSCMIGGNLSLEKLLGGQGQVLATTGDSCSGEHGLQRGQDDLGGPISAGRVQRRHDGYPVQRRGYNRL